MRARALPKAALPAAGGYLRRRRRAGAHTVPLRKIAFSPQKAKDKTQKGQPQSSRP